ncbi:hypothetical protein AtNW77_Chr4g0317361 [Arabidopsis thaliana]
MDMLWHKSSLFLELLHYLLMKLSKLKEKDKMGKTPFLLLVQILEVLNKERNGRALLANFAEEWSRLETAFKHVRGVFEFRFKGYKSVGKETLTDLFEGLSKLRRGYWSDSVGFFEEENGRDKCKCCMNCLKATHFNNVKVSYKALQTEVTAGSASGFNG